jgi:hypothetical protein
MKSKSYMLSMTIAAIVASGTLAVEPASAQPWPWEDPPAPWDDPDPDDQSFLPGDDQSDDRPRNGNDCRTENVPRNAYQCAIRRLYNPNDPSCDLISVEVCD